MSQALKADFNPAMIDTLRRAIDTRNVAEVKQALESGLNPNIYTYRNAQHLLMPLLFERYKNSDAAKIMDAATFAKNTSEIVELILAYGAKVAQPFSRHENENCRYLVDHFTFCDSPGDASTLVLQALAETADAKDGDVYKTNIQFQLRRYVENYLIASNAPGISEAQLRTILNQGLTIMECLHDAVRQRLMNPTTDTEKQLMIAHQDKLGYWLKPFPAPSLASLVHMFVSGQTPPQPSTPQGDIRQGGPMTGANNNAGPKAPPASQKSAGGDDDMQAAERMVEVMQRRSPAAVMAEIERDFIGLDSAKQVVRNIMIGELYDAACAVQDLKVTPERFSALFLGNPGLGKTTFARKYAELLHATGATGPNYIEIGPGGAVGKFVGHTEAKIQAILETADVLFIDEAYDLVAGGQNSPDFGRKVLTAVLRAIENRPDMVVIMAGYSEAMARMVSSNEGLSSRFSKQIVFEDMNREQLGRVLDLMTAQAEYTLVPAAREYILDRIEDARKTLGGREFGNARLVRTVVEEYRSTLGHRFFAAAVAAGNEEAANNALLLSPGKKDLRRVTLADAKAINYGMILGTDSKKHAQQVAQDDDEPSIGFGRRLKADRVPMAV